MTNATAGPVATTPAVAPTAAATPITTQTVPGAVNVPAAATGAAAAAAPGASALAGAANFPSASLYVGDLPTDISEHVLFDLFNGVGPVQSIRVCRDAITRRSLGYAYVNYHSATDAERAIDTLNGTPIKDSPCRIMWSQRDPSLRRSGVGNIFIKNLDKEIDQKSLYDTFSAFGNILSCKVVCERDGVTSKGYGFVHFETKEMAERAIEKVNGMMLNGKQVFVGPFLAKSQRSGGANGRFTNVFVKNVEESVSEETLKGLFAPYGPITSLILMTSAEGKSKGFGFVNFENAEDASKAVDELNGKEIEGKPMFVGRAQKKAEREAELRQKFEAIRVERDAKFQGVNLYVKNLDEAVDDDQLRTEFATVGKITSVKVMRDEKGVSRGFGFVCYSTPEEATKAVAELNGRMLGTKPLYVALHQRKEVRKAQLDALYAQRKQQNNFPSGPAPTAMYPAGQPLFYPQQPGFVYSQQMMPRGRWPGALMQGQYPMPYMVPNQNGQVVPGGAAQRRPNQHPRPAQNRRGGRRHQQQHQQQQQQQQQQQMPPMEAAPQLTIPFLSQFSPEQQIGRAHV